MSEGSGGSFYIQFPSAQVDSVEQIPERMEQIRWVRKGLAGAVKRLNAIADSVVEMCPHANPRKYSAMGEVGYVCDHCGKILS